MISACVGRCVYVHIALYTFHNTVLTMMTCYMNMLKYCVDFPAVHLLV